MNKTVLTVSELTSYLQGVLRREELLSDLWVAGEISNFHRHHSGHCYFTLKDKESRLRAVFFKNQVEKIKFNMENGLDVMARGYIDIYKQRGEYQLYVQEMEPAGIGALHLAFEQLKKKLEEEGLFSEDRKKPLPPFPQKVGVVSSASGAAIRDILAVFQRRSAGTSLLLAPARVQGEGAGEEIATALEKLARTDVDVIIVTRGGGSLEELWAFNEEVVARAIFACSKPVISAVGHERDFTIADFVADTRAPTPSAAAEMVVPDHRQIIKDIGDFQRRLKKGLLDLLERRKQELERLGQKRIFLRPQEELIERRRQHLDDLESKMITRVRHDQQMEKERLQTRVARLEGLSPLKILGLGYSICTDPTGEMVYKDSRQLKTDDQIKVILSRGQADARVTCIRENENEEDENGGQAEG